MENCKTPTLAQVMEFKYELTPTMVFDPSRLQDAQNLIVNRINVRCFTPTMKNFQSPGLSPINDCEQTLLGGVAVGVAANLESLQKTRAMTAAVKEEYFKVPLKISKNVQQKQTFAVQQQLQQQQQQMPQKFACHKHFVSDSPPVFTLNSTTNSDTDFSIDNTSPDSSAILGYANNNNNNNNSSNNDSTSVSLNSSNNVTFTNSLSNYYNNNNNTSNTSKNVSNSNLLDRTMNVSTLLRSVGLEQYIDGFEEQNMDLEQFLNLRAEDIPRLGIHSMEHQKILLDLLNELNGF
ncbi:protein matrimony-like [Bactrocera neohumeralis]|uniref:protein matrimony-like n=1 Tax=Bactrocera neohumeralis TaxID=98809 RepID=UPI0021669D6F|nr:protein matrimony-like [Bactrocera neohumeralis]